MAQKEVKGRIASVKNIQKITRAMEMVAAARLRRAEQRIAAVASANEVTILDLNELDAMARPIPTALGPG